MTGLAVLGGFVLDTLFGDPAWLPHPVVLMGKAISALSAWAQQSSARGWGWPCRCSGAGRHWPQRALRRRA